MPGPAVRNRSTILIVDDELGISRMLQVLLESRGFKTLVANSGAEALAIAPAAPVDLILLDVMMPGTDGHAVCRSLKADPRLQHVPIVMVTAKDTLRDKIAGLELGADDYIAKPFNNEELVARIRVLLRMREMAKEIVQRNRELSALHAVGSTVTRSLNLEEILDSAISKILDTMDLAGGCIHLMDSAAGDLVLRTERGLAAAGLDLAPRAKWGERLQGTVAAAGKPVVIENTAAGGAEWGLRAEGAPRFLACFPIGAQDWILGTVTVLGHPQRTLAPTDVDILVAIGRQIGGALENARLYGESQRKALEFQGLFQVGKTMASTFDVQEVLSKITEAVSGLLQAKAASIMLLSDDGKILSTVAGHPLPEGSLVAAEPIPPEHAGHPALVAVRERRPVAIRDLAQSQALAPWRAAIERGGFGASVSVPLIVQDRALGAINVFLGAPHDFNDEEVQLLSTFANQGAIAIENARLFEEARKLAITDELTGLSNHRHFYQQLAREVRRAQRYRRHLSLMMLDIDYFKRYNDRFGHLVGDQALRELAEVLRKNAREVDILARYGGEEFAIILPETELEQAGTQAERIRVAVSRHPFRPGESRAQWALTISLGVASLTPKMRKMEELVQGADEALYRAKAEGRNRVCLAT